MRDIPSYLKDSSESALPYRFILISLLLGWTLAVFISYLAINRDSQKATSRQVSNYNLADWVTSTSSKINQARNLTLHLARDYQTVEFLADINEPAEHISNYWDSHIKEAPYIERIGVVEEETNDLFYVGKVEHTPTDFSDIENELLSYWMQVSLLNNDDVLFNYLSESGHSDQNTQQELFRFTTPIHYEDLRLGHLYIDININELLSVTANELGELSQNVIMLDSLGNYVAESKALNKDWSAKTAFVENIGFYDPELWRAMNAMLSGNHNASSQETYFSKIDVPWYENQIKYFYLVEFKEKALQANVASFASLPILFIWLIGLFGFTLAVSTVKPKRAGA